jgi:hypothetical protein
METNSEPIAIVQAIPIDEEEDFEAILERTFAGFADEPWSSNLDVNVSDSAEEELQRGFDVDVIPRRGWIEGEREVVFDSDSAAETKTSFPRFRFVSLPIIF